MSESACTFAHNSKADQTGAGAASGAADLSNRVAALSRSLEDFTNGLKKPDPPPEPEAAPAPAVAEY